MIQNQLLRRLSANDLQRLSPHLQKQSADREVVLYEARAPVEFVSFPITAVLSALNVMPNGDIIEVGTIGNEGAGGLTAFLGPAISPNRVICQIPGELLRIEAASIREFAKESSTLYDVLLAHHHAFMAQVSQSVACNGLHSVPKRCCRWLLMTHDRVEGDEVPLTHEFLSFMLGVRRPGVTEALKSLESQGLITTARGTIRITDRAGLEKASCDCYRLVKEEYERLLGPAPA